MKNIICLFFSLLIIAGAQASLSPVTSRTLAVETTLYQVKFFQKYHFLFNQSLEAFEKKKGRVRENWKEKDWLELTDVVFTKENIYQETKQLKLDEKKERKNLLLGIKRGVVSIYRSTIAMGRNNGSEALTAYLTGTVLGYSLAGVGAVVGNVAIVSFFSVFPLGTLFSAAVIGIQKYIKRREQISAFNDNESRDYFDDYQKIQKNLEGDIGKIGKKERILKVGDHGFIIKKSSFFLKAIQASGSLSGKLTAFSLMKRLKKENLFSSHYKSIYKNKKIDSFEKVALLIWTVYEKETPELFHSIMSHFTESRIKGLTEIQNKGKIFDWAFSFDQIESLKSLQQSLSGAPATLMFLEKIEIFYKNILPRLSKRIRGFDFKIFKCIRKLETNYIALNFKNKVNTLISERAMYQNFINEINNCSIKN